MVTAADTPTERRPSSAELVAQVALGLHRAGAPEYEASLTLNAKGDVQIMVSGKADTLDVADAIAAKFVSLVAQFPRANGGTE